MNQKRILELDVFGGIAALAVLIFHYTTRYDQIYHFAKDPLFYFPYGEYGFHLFFIISGYVIYMTLVATKRGMDFVVKRIGNYESARLFV